MVEAMQLRFNMAIVMRALALELGQAMQASLTPQQRRSWFDALAFWCEDGTESSHGEPPSSRNSPNSVCLLHLHGGDMPCVHGLGGDLPCPCLQMIGICTIAWLVSIDAKVLYSVQEQLLQP